MKQKMMLAAIAAVISVGGFAGFNAYQNESPTITRLNAEALADDYVITDGNWLVVVISPTHWKCYENGQASCPGTKF